RLLRGDMNAATEFNPDPADQARSFMAAGFQWLHVVDLDGAFQGQSINAPAIRAILGATDQPVQLGGGIRDAAAIAAWLEAGVTRVILGTAALKNPQLVRQACRDFPGRIAIGIDARSGQVAVEGWAETSNVTAIDLAKRLEDAGAAALIHTDIERDGALQGPNAAATAGLARAVAMPVIASGGVSSLADLAALKAEAASGIAGVIVGRALYDGRIDPAAALALLAA
ncbi:MAG: 1-(5-phosphoribosyl)-5-[(5-phosphoribosylamino)methylideneamino]imidazole-4-carboxamide isomerase, partial [Alphaproteobacteria bacterium]|nr:1-(5-phosphoribosyl)-5-[(5-phosphoribosylamino)methylideneamino]imidazole-4-carboxamide isomerase [Alphaproteobacteria bacterium]